MDKLRNIILPHSVRGLSSDMHVRSEDYGILADVHRVSYERINAVLFFSRSSIGRLVRYRCATVLFAFENVPRFMEILIITFVTFTHGREHYMISPSKIKYRHEAFITAHDRYIPKHIPRKFNVTCALFNVMIFVVIDSTNFYYDFA